MHLQALSCKGNAPGLIQKVCLRWPLSQTQLQHCSIELGQWCFSLLLLRDRLYSLTQEKRQDPWRERARHFSCLHFQPVDPQLNGAYHSSLPAHQSETRLHRALTNPGVASCMAEVWPKHTHSPRSGEQSQCSQLDSQ